MIKVGVIGATGYTGEEIVKLLAKHKDVNLTILQAVIEKDRPLSDIFPHLKGSVDLVCTGPDEKKAVENTDLVFLALPHRVSMKVAPAFIKAGKKVIDLSADYRIEKATYEKWYGTEHTDSANIKKAVYGLPELFGDAVKKARFIANPGCYPTSVILSAAPLMEKGLADTDYIICDSKTGITGAGRKPGWNLDNPEVKDNFKAYKVNNHQHSPEMEEVLGRFTGKKAKVVFVPHLLPVERGILSTTYMRLKKAASYEEIVNIYKDKYKGCPFVKIKEAGQFPKLKEAVLTNDFILGLAVDTGKKLVIAVSAIDNLLKGAAGQAVQNMNIMCGFDEKEGLV